MPVIPNALTPANLPDPGCKTDSSVWMPIGSSSHGMAGFGWRKCKLRGRTPCFSASAVLMTPATPGCGFGVSYVGLHGADEAPFLAVAVLPHHAPYRLDLDWIADLGAGPVGLHIKYVAAPRARGSKGGAQQLHLRFPARRDQRAGSTAVIIAGAAADHGIDTGPYPGQPPIAV